MKLNDLLILAGIGGVVYWVMKQQASGNVAFGLPRLSTPLDNELAASLQSQRNVNEQQSAAQSFLTKAQGQAMEIANTTAQEASRAATQQTQVITDKLKLLTQQDIANMSGNMTTVLKNMFGVSSAGGQFRPTI